MCRGLAFPQTGSPGVISQRGFAALVVVTILAGVAAWAVSGSGPTDDVGTGQSVRMLPRLFEGLNDVRSLTVVGPEERFTVERVDDGWVMQEKGGHPVRYESVKGTLMALAGAVVSKPMAKKTTCLSGFSRAILTASRGE